MAVPAIGTTQRIGASGRLGVVVAAHVVGSTRDGRQLVHLTVRTVDGGAGAADSPRAGAASPSAGTSGRAPDGAAGAVRPQDRLSPAEKAQLADLQRRDAQVRQEENAHANAAGQLGGPIAYTYQRGPDGRMYALGGSVPLRAQTGSDPEEAARLGRRIAGAALAAVLPSSADYAAAAAAYSLAAAAAGTDSRRGSRADRTA